jgi:nucleoside diphosphate kinase
MTSNADAPAALGCELIAIKYLPRLTSTQIGIAGSKLSASAINDIRSGGCLIAVLRRIDAYKTLSTYSARKRISSVLHLSPSPSNCKAVIRTIFHPDELFEDLAMQPWRPYFKPSLLSQVGPLVDTYTDGMSTVVLVDASVVQKGQLAKVLKYARKENFVLEAMRMLQPKGGSSTAPPDSHVAFLSSRSDNAPLVVLMLQRVNAVAKWLQVNGPADPSVARKLDQFSLGTLLCAEGESNPIRGSMDYDCAQFEMTHFFHEYAERWASGKSVLDGAQNNLLSEPTLTNASRQLIQLDKSAVLREVICVVISAPPASLAGENENCIAMLEGLMHQEYQLINVRQVCMSRQQAEAYCKLHLVKHGTAAAKPPNAYDLAVKLSTSPAIVLALERDNALSRMASLVSSIPTDSQQWNWSEMYCSRSPQQASAELCFFFAELFSNYYKIVGNL